jgi:hypothetical protein
MQPLDLRLKAAALFVTGQLEPGQFFLMLLGQASDAQTLLLDQLRSFQTLFLIKLFIGLGGFC